MKLRIRNIILLIVHAVATILLFFPPMYLHVSADKMRTGYYVVDYEQGMPFTDLAGAFSYNAWTELFAIAVIMLFFVVFLVLLLQLIGKNERQQNSIVALAFSIINFMAFFLFSHFWTNLGGEYTSGLGRWYIELGSLYYIEMLLQIVLVVTFIITYVQTNRRIAEESSKGSAE